MHFVLQVCPSLNESISSNRDKIVAFPVHIPIQCIPVDVDGLASEKGSDSEGRSNPECHP